MNKTAAPEDTSITFRQMSVLNSLVCEHVRGSETNLKILEKFDNQRSQSILRHLKDVDVEDDKKGSSALYVVKSDTGVGLLAFCIKCSEVFHGVDGKSCQLKQLEQLFVSELYEQFGKKLGAGSAPNLGKLKGIVDGIAHACLDDMSQLIVRDWRKSKNKKIVLQHKTFSCVQLVDFCKNESQEAVEWWRANAQIIPSRLKMGVVLFWWFVAPIALEMQDRAGCEYISLFAADITEELSKLSVSQAYAEVEKLYSYYRGCLKFDDLDEMLCANKPLYDMKCHFMYQKMEDLANNRNEFLLAFNGAYV